MEGAQDAGQALAQLVAVHRGLVQQAEHGHDDHEAIMRRVLTPIAKFWVCKRGAAFAQEAMECLGGSGVMEDSPFPRLYREAPVNAIWEGSGNVQCLDVLRALQKTPEVADALPKLGPGRSFAFSDPLSNSGWLVAQMQLRLRQPGGRKQRL